MSSAAFLPTAAVSTHGQRTLPQTMYTSPVHHELEWERLLGQSWLLVMRASDLAKPGDYRVVELHGESIIVVRAEGGQIHAFFNLCRHRGTRLCDQAAGKLGPLIRCPYHAWTYGLDGRLVGVPDLKEMESFDRAEYSLHPCAIHVWEGFVFLNLAREPKAFEDALAPLIGRFSAYQLPSLVSLRRVEYDIKANWKLLHQNYSECYHCSPLHPSLVKLSPSTSGENDLVDGPVLGGFMVISSPGGSLTKSGRACAIPVGEVEPQRVYYYAIAPNMLLSLHHDYVMVHAIWPLGPGRTKVTCEFLFHPDAEKQVDFDPSDASEFWDQVNREDWGICERTYAGITSSRYVPGPYSRRESLSAAFDREYLRVMTQA